jgi:hypothetical protein
MAIQQNPNPLVKRTLGSPILGSCLVLFALYGEAKGQTVSSPEPSMAIEESANRWNIPLPTMGGKQFWTDHRWWNGWKVQYNSTLKHWRLLDPNGVRRAWGGKLAMIEQLQKVAAQSKESPPDEVVLLVHGLFRSKDCMRPIAEEVQRSNLASPDKKRVCISINYASTRDPIAQHSEALRELIENLPGQPQISFVGHSLGNIVFRYSIGEWQRNGDPKNVLPRLHRAVMLGPPNQGSSFAASLSRVGLFESITGSTGMHLGPAWKQIQDALGTPPCPFAIVVGDISESMIQNPLLEGPSDGVVTTNEAYLEGASEVITVPVVHSFLMSDSNAISATVRFLDGK